MLNSNGISLDSYRIIAVSPHFDDVALSLSGLLLDTAQPTVVVTVHGGRPEPGQPVSEWDADCGFVTAESAYRTRLAEDAASCAAMGVASLNLPNADGPYRDGASLAGLDEVVRAAAGVADLYLPAGIDQPDHRCVRDQALAALEDLPGPRPYFYADLPYSAVTPGWFELNGTGSAADEAWPEPVRELGCRYPAGLELVHRSVIRGDLWEGKRRAVLHHSSQLVPVGSMDEIAGSRPLLAVDGPLTVEAVWRPRSVAPRDGSVTGTPESRLTPLRLCSA